MLSLITPLSIPGVWLGDPLPSDAALAAQWLVRNLPQLAMGAGTTAAKILFLLAVAFVVRYVSHRAIDRVTRVGDGTGRVPLVLRPLRERAADALLAPLLSERRAQRARTIGSLLKSLTSFLVYGVACVEILSEFKINVTPIVASAGIVGVGLGFGAQNLVRDFISGIFMMLEDQYGVGDVVDVGQASGTVEAVGLRVTTLRDVNGTVWYVRNGTVQRIGNKSQGFAVAVVDLPLAYTTDVSAVSELVGRVATEAAEHAPLAEDVLEPPEVLGVENITPETITLRITAKVRPGRQWAVQRALRAQLMAALRNAGFNPPLPTNFFGRSPADPG